MADAGLESEAQLIARAQAGDPTAQDTLLRQHQTALLAFARLHMGPALRQREETWDIVQSALRDVLGHLRGFEYRGSNSFRNWLFAHAIAKIRNAARHHQAERRDQRKEVDLETLSLLYGSLCSPTRALDAREQVARLEAAFDQLPEHYREVILLAKLEGCSAAEIGERTGRGEGAVRMLLSRALVRLASLVES